MNLLMPLNTCERVLEALRRYDERDRAIDTLVAEIERARASLVAQLAGRPGDRGQ